MGMELQKHPSVDYDKTFESHDEALQDSDVQTAAKHHGVSLKSLAKRLANGGLTIAIVILMLLGATVNGSTVPVLAKLLRRRIKAQKQAKLKGKN